MNIVLSGRSALRMLRTVRGRQGAKLVICDRPPVPSRLKAKDLPAVRQALPKNLAAFDREGPLSLLFFSREDRPRLEAIKASALLAKPLKGAFCEVVGCGLPEDDADGPISVYVESPALVLVRMAQELNARVCKKALTRQAALFRLVALGCELCGLYSRDAEDPVDGQMSWGVDPVVTSSELRRTVNALSGIRGLRLARSAAAQVVDCSGSPTETLLALAMSMPICFGGMEYPAFLQNRELEWPKGFEGLIHHKTMRPDFYWPDHKLAIEYNGRVHDDDENAEEDHFRRQDYATCGVAVLEARSSDIRDVASLERFLRLVALKLSAHEDADFLRRVEGALLDPTQSGTRATLISQVMPQRRRKPAAQKADAKTSAK